MAIQNSGFLSSFKVQGLTEIELLIGFREIQPENEGNDMPGKHFQQLQLRSLDTSCPGSSQLHVYS